MRGQLIVAALKEIGCRDVQLMYEGKALATCPNEHEHSDGIDSRASYAVFFDEKSAIGVCLSCHFKEPLDVTMLRLQFERGENFSETITSLVLQDEDEVVRNRLKKINEIDFDAPKAEKAPTTIGQIEYELFPESAFAKFAGTVPRYALQRGLTLETCRTWELGHDKHRARLLFPVRNYKGQLVGVSGRTYREYTMCPIHLVDLKKGQCTVCDWTEPRKYLHSKGNPARRKKWRSLVLYGEHMLVPKREGLLVEGVFDVLMPWQAGVRNIVAGLGSMIDDIQVMKMRTWWDDLWIWGDPDAAGNDMEESVAARFEQAGGHVHRLVDKPDVDPGDKSLTPEEIVRVLKASKYSVFKQ